MYYSSRNVGSFGIGPGRLTPGVKWVLIVTVSFYILQNLMPAVFSVFVLKPIGSNAFFIWQPLTYMFIHGNIFHILFNLFAFWMFGVPYEKEFGTDKLFSLYFLSGILSGLAYAIFLDFNGLIGASAGVYGVLVSFAYFWPNSLIFIFGIIPVRAKYLIIGLMIFGIMSSVNASDGVAHLAHIFGGVFGFIFLQIVHGRYNLLRSFVNFINNKKDNITYSIKSKKQEKIINKDEWTKEKIDFLLEKVSKYGIGSLTKKEKDFLDKASKEYR